MFDTDPTSYFQLLDHSPVMEQADEPMRYWSAVRGMRACLRDGSNWRKATAAGGEMSDAAEL